MDNENMVEDGVWPTRRKWKNSTLFLSVTLVLQTIFLYITIHQYKLFFGLFVLSFFDFRGSVPLNGSIPFFNGLYGLYLLFLTSSKILFAFFFCGIFYCIPFIIIQYFLERRGNNSSFLKATLPMIIALTIGAFTYSAILAITAMEALP